MLQCHVLRPEPATDIAMKPALSPALTLWNGQQGLYLEPHV